MRYIKKSTKFQPHENRALTTNNRPSVSAPHLLGTMQVFLISAPQKMPALRGHFCFCLTVLLAAQATFSPPLRLSAWFGAFHFRFHRFQDNGCLAFGFRPVLSGCLANFFKIVLSPVRDMNRPWFRRHLQAS